MSAIFLLVYVIFLLVILLEKVEKAFVALVIGTIFFPCCALFNDSPSVSGQIILLYAFLFKQVVFETKNFNDAFFKGPLRVFLFLVFGSYFLTTVFNFSGKNAYYAIRDIIDLYGYFLAAMIASKHLSLEKVAKALYWFVFVMCFYGLYEAATCSNILYKLICSAFPAYDGWYNLNGSICASEGWRMRTILTTKHPTTLGNLLMILFLFYWNVYQGKFIGLAKIVAVLVLLCLNIVVSGSRTSLACVTVALLYSYMKTKGVLMKILFVGLLVFSASFIVNYTIEHFLDNKDGSSIMLRLTQLSFSFEKIQESPIWGNGSNYTAHEIKDEGVRFNDDEEFIGGLESVAFIYMIDRGLFGVLTFFLFWLAAFWYLKKNDELFAPKKVTLEIMPMGIILFLTMSGLIGNNTSFCFLFLGLYIGNMQKKKLECEKQKDLSKAGEIEREKTAEF